MDPSAVENQLKRQVREGLLYLRADYSKEWEERWVVLTNNFILIFQDNTKQRHSDSIDLAEVKKYSSYVRKEEDLLPSALKMQTNLKTYYLSFHSAEEKWSWIVTLERLMDFKMQGPSHYNSEEAIVGQGFKSQQEYLLQKKGKAVQSGDGEALRREVERLKAQLEKQQKQFETMLKEKYKHLNAIEAKMVEKQKQYEELSHQIQRQSLPLPQHQPKVIQSPPQEIQSKPHQSTPSPQVSHLKEKIRELNLHLEQKSQTINKYTHSLAQLERQLKELKVELSQANKKVQYQPTNHVIKSYYMYDIVESMVGFSLSKEQQGSLHLKTSVIEESSPNKDKHKSGKHETRKQETTESKAKVQQVPVQQSSPRQKPSLILKELSLENTKLTERLKEVMSNELLLRKEIKSLKREIADLRGEKYVEEPQKVQVKPTTNDFTPSKVQKQERAKQSKLTTEQKQNQSPSQKPSWIKPSSKNDGLPVWVRVRADQDNEKTNKPEVESPVLTKKESKLVSEMKKLFQAKSKE